MGQVRPEIGIFQVALNESSPIRQTLGKPIDLQLETRAKIPRSFHVRLIRGEKNDLIVSGKGRADRNGCVTFPSIVIKVSSSSSDGAIHLGTLGDPAYLQRIDRSHLGPADYVLVFEEGDQPTDSIIRIHKNHLDSYFKFAYPMRLSPSEPLMREVPNIVARAVRTMEDRTRQFQKIEDQTIHLARPAQSPCLAVKLRTDVAGIPEPRGSILLAASLGDCEVMPQSAPPSAASPTQATGSP